MLKTFENFTKYNNKKDDLVTYKISIKELENLYKYFHISTNFLIDDNDDDQTFVFNAKVPHNPYNDDDGKIIEDDFTNRVSLASDVKSCLLGIPDSADDIFYLYGVDLKNDLTDDIETVDLKGFLDKCPIIKGTKYGVDFNLDDWLNSLSITQTKEIQKFLYNNFYKDDIELSGIKYNEIDIKDFIFNPSDLPQKYKKLFYACVPDADKTNEFWSLKNLKMVYLGEFGGYHDEYVHLTLNKFDNIPLVIKNLKSYNKKILSF